MANMVMGSRIHDKRKENNLSLEELGSRLGVGKGTVSRWEHGAVENIKRTHIEQMAKIFNCNPVWLMGLGEEEKAPQKVFHHEIPIHISNSDRLADMPLAGSRHLDEAMIKISEIGKALALYERYKKAIPQIQDAVDNLLKSSQPDLQAESQSDS